MRLKEPAPGGCQGKKRGVGAGRSKAQDTAPNALTAARSWLRSRVRAGTVETGGCEADRVRQDETPRGEREAGAVLWPHLTGFLKGVAPGVDARQGRDAVRGSTRSAKTRSAA